jgi:hypothetical protein
MDVLCEGLRSVSLVSGPEPEPADSVRRGVWHKGNSSRQQISKVFAFSDIVIYEY